MPTLNLGFLASHGGSNMQAIIDACKSGRLDAAVRVVISNNSDSKALERAKKEGLACYHISSKTDPGEGKADEAILDILIKHGIDTVVLAGYMKKLGDNIVNHFNKRVLNIHPALLPKYGGHGMFGINVHKAVLRAGEKYTGVTVHLVDSEFDQGRILAQKQVPVMEGDSPETLSERVLAVEHELYWQTLQSIAENKIVL